MSGPDSAILKARPGLTGKTGPGETVAQTRGRLPYGSGPAAFKSRPPAPFAQNPGPQPNTFGPWIKRFIPPLALFNDAAQWVNRLHFVRPMTFQQTPDSNPPLLAQYFTPPPVETKGLAAGARNDQQQLGSIRNQAQQLTLDASNYFGG